MSKVLKRDVNQAMARSINTFGGLLDYTIHRINLGWQVEVSSELTDKLYCITIQSSKDLYDIPKSIGTISADVHMNGSMFRDVVRVVGGFKFEQESQQLKDAFKEALV